MSWVIFINMVQKLKTSQSTNNKMSVLIVLLFDLKFQAHGDSCQYGDVQCRACGQTLERRHIEQHRTKECINRAITCTYCGQGVPQIYMKVKGRFKVLKK